MKRKSVIGIISGLLVFSLLPCTVFAGEEDTSLYDLFSDYPELSFLFSEENASLYDDILLTQIYDETSEDLGSGYNARSNIAISGMLQFGSTGEEVRAVQSRLTELGYSAGEADGIFGAKTEEAVRAFQRDHGLYADGIVGNQSIAVINQDHSGSAASSAPSAAGDLPSFARTLVYGTSGSDVKAMQEILQKLGYSVGTPDGDFGPATEAAVYAFQKDHGLYQDGAAGNQTLGLLRSLTGSSERPSSDAGNAAAPVSVSISRTLSYGSSGTDVAQLQSVLDQLGYQVGAADGNFGNMTESAVLKFQKDHNLYADGAAGPLTIAAMNQALKPNSNVDSNTGRQDAPKTNTDRQDTTDTSAADSDPEEIKDLSYGMTGNDVKEIQTQLISLGYLKSGQNDGKFGASTQNAVKAFQSANGSVNPSGIVDDWFRDKLDGSPIPQSDVAFNKKIMTSSGEYNFTRNSEIEMEGDDIKLIQDRLAVLGYLEAIPGGYFGNMTQEAVLAFQKDAGLSASGGINPDTLDVLFSETAPESASTQLSYTASPLTDAAIITDKNYNREGNEIKYIIPHHMAGALTGEQCAAYFVHNGLENSANYCIGYNGDIAVGVPEEYGAWTSSWWAADEQGITIEVSDTSKSDFTIPKKAQDSLVDLCVDLFRRNPSLGNKMIYDESDKDIVIAAKKARDPEMLSKVKGNVLLHNWTSGGTTTCPGEGMLKVLPDIVKRVNEKLEK